MRYLIRTLVLLLTTQLSPAQTWEPINANYTNLRGINFVPVYTNRTVGTTQTGTPAGPSENASIYHGVATATAMWRFYDSASVSTQLSYAKRAGFNAVRVFLSYPAWRYYENTGTPTGILLARWNDFVGLCDQKKLKVMPVLWDDVDLSGLAGREPDYADPIGQNSRPILSGPPTSIAQVSNTKTFKDKEAECSSVANQDAVVTDIVFRHGDNVNIGTTQVKINCAKCPG